MFWLRVRVLASKMQRSKCGWTVMDGVQAHLSRLDTVQPLLGLMHIRLHCGHLILRKISKIGATRYQVLSDLSLKCIKFDFRCGCAPDLTGEQLTALPRI